MMALVSIIAGLRNTSEEGPGPKPTSKSGFSCPYNYIYQMTLDD
jgi:hypothetical protein